MPTAGKDLCGGGRGPSAARFAHKSGTDGVEAAVWNRAWPRWCRSPEHGGSAAGRAAAAALGVALAGNRAGEAASAATVDPRAALMGRRRHGGGAAARGGDVVGEFTSLLFLKTKEKGNELLHLGPWNSVSFSA